MECKIYGGTCGVGGFCEDCPHKDHSEDVLDMVAEKPLDRGEQNPIRKWIDENWCYDDNHMPVARRKLIEWIAKNMTWADFQGESTQAMRAGDLLEAINSGRLDVEEG